jgi:leishmanolysin-like peptidase
LEGAELEDQGEIGTKLTHWEKRVFENEAMTGTYTQNSVFSRITFAFLEDTGYLI